MSRSNRNLPVIAIAGRPNVGKSTLFNRFIGRRRAITDPTPGVTRDPVSEPAVLAGRDVLLVDTGGYIPDAQGLDSDVSQRSIETVQDADCVVLVLDIGEITAEDEEFIGKLRPYAGKLILAVNKADNDVLAENAWNYHSLGFSRVVWISAVHGRNISTLEENILEIIGKEKTEDVAPEDDRISLVILGKPNTGKSTLSNLLTDSDSSIVSDIPGTTRDVIQGSFTYKHQEFNILDTAGIRRKQKVTENVEYYSVNRAISSIEQADIVLLVVDATEGITEQDKKIAALAERKGKGIILVMNKWDTLEDIPNQYQAVCDRTRFTFPILEFAPIIDFSALHGVGLDKLLKSVLQVWKQLNAQITTPVLNKDMKYWNERYSPPGQNKFRVKYITQTGFNPVSFVLFVNRKKGFPKSWVRYLINRIRETYKLNDIPISIDMRE